MQENLCGILFLWKFNQRKLRRKYWDPNYMLWRTVNKVRRPFLLLATRPYRQSKLIILLRRKVLTQYTPSEIAHFFSYPLVWNVICLHPLTPGEGEGARKSLSPAPQPRSRGTFPWLSPQGLGGGDVWHFGLHTLQKFSKDQRCWHSNPPSEMTFKGPLRKSRLCGGGGGGRGLWILNGIALTWKTC